MEEKDWLAESMEIFMQMLVPIALTAVITAFVTNVVVLDSRDERYAKLLWAKCPQLILEPHHPERAFIQMLDGAFVPIRPRPMASGASLNN